jgi:hypothetical protein
LEALRKAHVVGESSSIFLEGREVKALEREAKSSEQEEERGAERQQKKERK